MNPSLPPELPRADIEADRTTIGGLITSVLDAASTPLRGCTWLIGRNMDSDTRWVLRHKGVLSDSRYNELARRALGVPPASDIAEAAQLLSEVITYSGGAVMDTVRAHTAELDLWYAAIAPENGWALGDLANSLHRPDSEFAARIAGLADARRLARLILDGGWPHIYSSSHAVDRLCNVSGQPLRDAIRPHLDEAAFKQMLDTNPPELAQMSMLIENISAADHDLSLRLLEHSAKRIALLLSGDPVRRWNDLFGLLFHVLGYGAISFGDKDDLPTKCRPAARALVRELDHEEIAHTLAGPQDQWGQMNFDAFIGLIERSDPPTFAAIVERIDFTKLEESLTHPAGRPTRTGLYLCLQLSELKRENVHEIMDRLEPTLTELDSFIAFLAPEVAARALRRGLPLDLQLDHHHWGWAAALVARLAEHDADLAREVVESNRAGMIEGLTNNMTTPFDRLSMWVEVCDRLDPELVDTLIAELPEGAITKWDRAIRRPQRYGRWRRDQIAPLVIRATRMTGHVQSEATELIRRFPALKAYEVQ